MPPHRRGFLTGLALASATWSLGEFANAQTASFGEDGEAPANVFISPCGKPFRAKPGAPYPLVDWFRQADKDGDGKLELAEFIADSMAFFKVLDRNGDNIISPQEVAFYEQRIAPEVLGMRVDVRNGALVVRRPALILTQGYPGGIGGIPGGGGMGDGGSSGRSHGNGPIAPEHDDTDTTDAAKAKPYDASGVGAAPYGFFNEPEPVTAADLHFRGLISRGDFAQAAENHFAILDPDGHGFVALDTLPSTLVQRRLNHGRRRR